MLCYFEAALNNGGVGKTSYFEAKCVNISKSVGYTSKVGTCESYFFVRIESRIESAVRFVFESNIRIESAVYHASRNTA